MLIRYEYELLSYIATKGIKKINGDLIVSFKRIEEELKEDNIDNYLQVLESKGIIELDKEKIKINTDKWIDIFIFNLNKNFTINKMNVFC
ncbi:hypothetical protein, partial [Clostridium baratii]